MTSLYITGSKDRVIHLGYKGFYPESINISATLSQASVDALFDYIYNNRLKWPRCQGRTLHISELGANPSGILQEPAGFVLGSNDGAPASAKEKIFVLVNNYNWIITYPND